MLRPGLAAALGPERFLREIEIAAKLNHPYNIEIPSLRDKLAKEGEFPIGDAVRILRDVVDALTEAATPGGKLAPGADSSSRFP